MFYKGELIEMSEEHSVDITEEISTHIVNSHKFSCKIRRKPAMNSWTEGIHKSSHILASQSYCAFCAKPLEKAKMFATILKNILNHLSSSR